MSTLKNNVTVTLLYQDGNTRSYTFENVAANDLMAVKSVVKAINKNENNQYAAFYSTFISPDGAAVEKIEAARIVSTQEEVLYSEDQHSNLHQSDCHQRTNPHLRAENYRAHYRHLRWCHEGNERECDLIMADVIKTAYNLVIETVFVDGDTRTITIKNPRSNISQSDITDLNSYMQENNIIIGDKDGSTFGRIKKVTRRSSTTTYLDISDE